MSPDPHLLRLADLLVAVVVRELRTRQVSEIATNENGCNGKVNYVQEEESPCAGSIVGPNESTAEQ